MHVRIISRVVIYDPNNQKILLAKNRGTNFWYPPGGGWEHEHETILECAHREVAEETGIDVEIKRLLYTQEFHATQDTIFFEIFWLGIPQEGQEVKKNHIDTDPNGQVEAVQWYDRQSLQNLKVFPVRLKNTFWDNITKWLLEEDPFIGIS